jgi:hypothetical protein
MTETGRPYGGTNERPDGEGLPGERPEQGQVTADPAQEPRAAEGGMSEDVTRVPEGGAEKGAEKGADAKRPGMPDATGPTG